MLCAMKSSKDWELNLIMSRHVVFFLKFLFIHSLRGPSGPTDPISSSSKLLLVSSLELVGNGAIVSAQPCFAN